MTQFGLSDSIIQQIRNVFSQYSQIEKAIIFGSRAMGNHKKGSDIDIALKGHKLSDCVTKVQYELNEETSMPYYFDVINYYDISNQDLVKHIDELGKVIFQREV